MARPRFEPTDIQREVVRALLCCGVPIARCAGHVVNAQTRKPLSSKTFVRVFKKDIATAVDICNAEVARNLFRIATADNHSAATVAAAIFWLRTRAGWTYSDPGTPPRPPGPEESPMVDNLENAESIMRDVLLRYGRERLYAEFAERARDAVPGDGVPIA